MLIRLVVVFLGGWFICFACSKNESICTEFVSSPNLGEYVDSELSQLEQAVENGQAWLVLWLLRNNRYMPEILRAALVRALRRNSAVIARLLVSYGALESV